MPGTIEYKGLRIPSPLPKDQGGQAIATNFLMLANQFSTNSFIVIARGDTDMESGDSLRAGYDQATQLLPGGNPLSADNRATIILQPGRYDLGDTGLTLDTEFLDIVGIAGSAATTITSHDSSNTRGTIRQTADDVRLQGLTIETTASGTVSYTDTDPAAYYPDTNLSSARLFDIVMKSSADGVSSWSMRTGIEYSGQYESCTAGAFGFGGAGTASGTFHNCRADDGSFGGGTWEYNAGGTASGFFIACVGGNQSFGSWDAGIASGEFIDCVGGSHSFGSFYSYASGKFVRCQGGYGSLGGETSVASGEFIDCTGDVHSFGGNGGNATGKFERCVAGDYSFGWYGSVEGEFTDCVGGDGSFSVPFPTTYGHLAVMRRCRSRARTEPVNNWAGTMIDCEIEVVGLNQHAVVITGTPRIYNTILIANGTGASIYASAATNASIANLLTNKAIDANITNLISNPNVIVDPNVTL